MSQYCDCGLCIDCGAIPLKRYGTVTLYSLPKPGPGPHGRALYSECAECEQPVMMDGRDPNSSALLAFMYWGVCVLHGLRDCPAIQYRRKRA